MQFIDTSTEGGNYVVRAVPRANFTDYTIEELLTGEPKGRLPCMCSAMRTVHATTFYRLAAIKSPVRRLPAKRLTKKINWKPV